MTRRFNVVIGIGVVVAIATGVIVAYTVKHHTTTLLPSAIATQLPYSAYVPDQSWEGMRKTVSYKDGILRFTVQRDGIHLVFTEQATPATFSEIPQYYTALLSKLNQYSSISSPLGTVYLTKPTELKGDQTAVIETGGTLCFVRPDQALTDESWKQIFASLQKVTHR